MRRIAGLPAPLSLCPGSCDVAISASQSFSHRLQRICVAGNAFRSAGRIFGPIAVAISLLQPFSHRSQRISARGRRFCIVRAVFQSRTTGFGLREEIFGPIAVAIGLLQPFSHRLQRMSVRGRRFCIVRTVFQSRATRFGPREEIFASIEVAIGPLQLFRIVCNACRCAGGVFALFAPCFSRGQHVLVRGKKFLRRSKLRSIRRSCDQCGATVFAPIPDRERVEPGLAS
ncbi:MAG TPA: hypothetical protein VNU68_11350 [Verrucomicrobiae bacterium]|nr:hypothetical protein [Verrucomicrobiae bacterium]